MPDTANLQATPVNQPMASDHPQMVGQTLSDTLLAQNLITKQQFYTL